MVVSGEVGVETAGRGKRSRSSILVHAARAAATTPTYRRFAERAVVPTLAAAGLGLLTEGAVGASAVMRPDYASGPGLAFSLENLQAVARCARQGMIVRDAEALRRLVELDVLLIGHHPSLESAEPEIASIEASPPSSEVEVLQYADAALNRLDDERTPAFGPVAKPVASRRSIVRPSP